MPWYTDEQILAIPGLAELGPERVAEVAADAGAIYAHLRANAGAEEHDLRVWAEGAEIPPERFNAATALLTAAGKLVRLAPSAALPGLAATASSIERLLSEAFTAAELGKAAGRVGAEVAKSAPKEELARAIAEAALAT